MDVERDDKQGENLSIALTDCPLPRAVQTRNLLVFAGNWGLIYLASPVTYVGVFQATLVDDLKFSNTVANLPATVYLWASPLSVLVLCRFPRVRMLKPLLLTVFLAGALMGALVTVALLSGNPNVLLAALITYAAVWGCANGVSAACQWEMIGRGVSASRRGQALTLSFGFGPMLAVLASVVSQSILPAKDVGLALPFIPRLDYPWNFAVLYGASIPIMLLAAFLSSLYVTPPPAIEPPRQPFLVSVFGGFGEYFRYRLLLIATIAYVLVYSGHEVMQNMSLYGKEMLRQDYAGYQMTLRFGFKIFAGFALGWLLIKTNPKALLIATASLTFISVAWALAVPGMWYLISFGILGAGELFGVYYLNYILGCSPPENMRRNIGFASMATMLVGFAPIIYGTISDGFGRQGKVLASTHLMTQTWAAQSSAPTGAALAQELAALGALESDVFTQGKVFGFQMSFVASLGVLVTTLLIVMVLLPKQPRPRSEDVLASSASAP